MSKAKRFALIQSAMACAVMLLAACAGNDGQTPAESGTEGAMQVSVQGLSASQIQSVVITARPANVSRPLEYQADSGTFAGTLVLPVGTQSLTANGYAAVPPDAGFPDAGGPADSGSSSGLTLVASGTATVEIIANTTAAVAMNIYDLAPAKPKPDIGPMIYSATTSGTSVPVNRPISLAVAAVDLDGDPLTYAWTSDCPSSVFTAPTSAVTDWYSPEPGTCRLTATASSRGLSTSLSLNVVVTGTGPSTGNAQVTGNYIPRPEVYAISAFHSSYLPRTTIHRSDSSANLPQLRSGSTYEVEVFVDFGTPLGASRTVDLTATCGTVQRTSDSCAGPVRLSSCSVQFAWAAPFAGSVCKLTGSASNESLTDGFSIGVPLL